MTPSSGDNFDPDFLYIRLPHHHSGRAGGTETLAAHFQATVTEAHLIAGHDLANSRSIIR